MEAEAERRVEEKKKQIIEEYIQLLRGTSLEDKKLSDSYSPDVYSPNTLEKEYVSQGEKMREKKESLNQIMKAIHLHVQYAHQIVN